jgi:hypothetical protein
MNLRALALSLSDELAELVRALAQLASAQSRVSRAFLAPKRRLPRQRRSLRAEAKRVQS